MGGVQNKKILIETDEPDFQPTLLTFTAIIPQIATVEPLVTIWGINGPLQAKSVRVTFPVKSSYQLIGSNPEKAEFAVEVREIETGRVFDLIITPRRIDEVIESPIHLLLRSSLGESGKNPPIVINAFAKVAAEQPPGKP